MESSASESPFKRDEPVFSSRKWLLIAFIAACAWLVFTLYYKTPLVYNSEDWGMELLWLVTEVGIQAVLVGFLLHALKSVWRCGERRSFEFMAVAVKSQRGFLWGMAIVAAAGSIFFPMWAHESRAFNTGLKQLVQHRKNPPPQAQAPPQTPLPQAPPQEPPAPIQP